jgi:hypothetical protein
MTLCMFRAVPLSIIRSYSLYTQEWYMPYRLVDGTAGPSWSCCCSKAVYKPVWRILLLSVQWITPDDGQRNCPKHLECHFQNKFEKLVHLVGFIIRKDIKVLWYITCEMYSGKYNVRVRLHSSEGNEYSDSTFVDLRRSQKKWGTYLHGLFRKDYKV